MYCIYGLSLGIAGLWLSKKVFKSFYSPLGIYSAVWAILVFLHYLVGTGNSGIFFGLGDRTIRLIFTAWGVWIASCLLAAIQPMRPRHAATKVDAESSSRLKVCLVVLIGIACLATLINVVALYRAGILFHPGDEWRDMHFMRMRDQFGQFGAIMDSSVPFSLGAVYAAVVLGIYAVVRHEFGFRWAVIPSLLGFSYDLTAAGRFWITQAGVLVVISWLLFSRRRGVEAPMPVPQSNGTPLLPRQAPSKGNSRVRTVLPLVLFLLLPVVALKGISMLRSQLTIVSDTGINLGEYHLEGPFVSPVIYAAGSLALFNYYAENGYDWEQLDGELAVGGVLSIAKPMTWILMHWDPNQDVLMYNDATNEPRPVGPHKRTVYFATYLLPALSDFSDLGVILYPLLFAFLVTKVFLRAWVEAGLFSLLLYPLAAVWIAMTVMRWELISTVPWVAVLYLFIASVWIKGGDR